MRSKDELRLITFGILLILFGWILGLKTEEFLIENGVHVLKNGKVIYNKNRTKVIGANYTPTETENIFLQFVENEENKRYDEYFKNK